MNVGLIERVGKVPGHWLVKCICTCGKEFIARENNIKTGHTKSCGCRRQINFNKPDWGKWNLRHNECSRGRRTSEYRAWANIKDRCCNAQNAQYRNYGGRGISICLRWKNSFRYFLKDMGRKPSRKHSIDRINNNGNYGPKNCRWATQIQQIRNRRPRSEWIFKNVVVRNTE